MTSEDYETGVDHDTESRLPVGPLTALHLLVAIGFVGDAALGVFFGTKTALLMAAVWLAVAIPTEWTYRRQPAVPSTYRDHE